VIDDLNFGAFTNSDIPLVFIIDLFEKKTCQIEACISPKLQFDKFFDVQARLFTKICKKTQKNCQIPACDVQKLTVMIIIVNFKTLL
jgi:hypothetical protein